MHYAMIEAFGKSGIATRLNDATVAVRWQDDRDYPGSLASIIANGQSLAELGSALAEGEHVAIADITFRLPLDRPGKIICVGLNYRDHAAEASLPPPAHPELFLRTTTSLVPAGAAIRSTPLSEQLDYEGELVAVIGATGQAAGGGAALDRVIGYSIFNDVSVRDYQFRSSQWTVGKNFDGTGAFGPWIVDAAALPAGGSGLQLTTQLNGQTVQAASTADLMFDVATLIERLSATMTLDPGDIIVTGTPGGVGLARKPPLWMKPGDRVSVSIEGIGTLDNSIG